MKRYMPGVNRIRLLVTLLTTVLTMPVVANAGSGEKTLDRRLDPVIIAGVELSPLLDKPIHGLRLFAFRNSAPSAIPFQVDERDSDGNWVWDWTYRHVDATYDEDMPGRRWDPARHSGKIHDDEDPPGEQRLDRNDVLVFMAEDLGDRANGAAQGLADPVMLEIKVTDPATGRQGWAYMGFFETDPPPRSRVRYMQYRVVDKRIISPLYDFRFSDTQVAHIEDLRVKGIPIINRIRIRGQIDLELPLISTALNFTADDIHGHTEGYIAGPVRIVKRNIAHIDVARVIQTPEVTCEHYYYPRYAQIPVCITIRFPAKRVSMLLTTEYRGPPLQRAFLGTTTGGASELSTGSTTTGSDHAHGTEWIALDSDTGSIVSVVLAPHDIEAHARIRPCICRDQTGPIGASVLTGTGNRAGFLITSTTECPKGEHVLYGTYLISAEPYEPHDEDAAFDLQHNRLTVEVTELREASQHEKRLDERATE